MKKLILTFACIFGAVSAFGQQTLERIEPSDTTFSTAGVDSTVLSRRHNPGLQVSQEPEQKTIEVIQDTLITDWPDEYLDTVQVSFSTKLNDYSMIGFNYGVTLTGMQFSPSHSQSRDLALGHYSLTFTHYEKMFNYLPYFGWTIGLEYGHEGYHFKENKETGETYEYPVERSRAMKMDVVEVPFMMQVHRDGLYSKVYAGIGIYGGYRLAVERSGPNVNTAYQNKFYDTDIRWDYGFQGGAGLAFIFEPFELHLNAQLRYGLSSIFQANSLYPADSDSAALNSTYYRYAYPLDIIISAGIHIQLGKRFGTTSADLKRQAKEIVYGKDR